MKRLISIAGVLLSLAVIAFLLTTFDVAEAAEALSSADATWLAPAALLYLSLFWLRGLRWTALLAGVAKVKVSVATEVFVIGAMANNVLPARLGDVARAFVLARREKIPATTTLSNVLLERIVDGFTVVGLLVAILLIAPPGAEWVRSVGFSMAAIFVIAMSGCALLAWNEHRALKIIAALLKLLPDSLGPKIHARVALLVRGLDVLRRPRALLAVLALSLVIWLLEVAVYALVQQAFGLTIPPEGLVLVMAVLTLGLTAPSAPGFVGVYEGLIVAAVVLYGVEPASALAFAITMHLIHYVPVTLLGLGYAWRGGIKLSELKGAQSSAPLEERQWT